MLFFIFILSIFLNCFQRDSQLNRFIKCSFHHYSRYCTSFFHIVSHHFNTTQQHNNTTALTTRTQHKDERVLLTPHQQPSITSLLHLQHLHHHHPHSSGGFILSYELTSAHHRIQQLLLHLNHRCVHLGVQWDPSDPIVRPRPTRN